MLRRLRETWRKQWRRRRWRLSRDGVVKPHADEMIQVQGGIVKRIHLYIKAVYMFRRFNADLNLADQVRLIQV